MSGASKEARPPQTAKPKTKQNTKKKTKGQGNSACKVNDPPQLAAGA